MKRKLNKMSRILFSASVIGWIIIGILLFNFVNVDASNSEDANIYKKLKLFSEVLFNLRQNYVEELDVDDLIDSAIKGMLDEVDPHTYYFTPDEFEKFSTDTKGEFGGLGISIDKKGDYITVVAPIEGTPAYRMGILAGDKISKVDGESVVGVSTDESIKKMRGEPGTEVLISIIRPGVEEELEFEIIREIIKIHSIPYSFKLNNGIGYMRIRQFNANTTSDMREKLDELEEEGIRGLIIDLRFNPGGLLREAINTVNEFIGKGKLVVFTKGRAPQTNMEYLTKYNRIRDDYPVIVLINGGSASASEIFAGSLQDWDRGLIVGQTSFGKGSVQRLFPLSDGNGIKITTAKYYIESGRCIHKDLNDKLLKDERVKNGDITKEEIEEMQEEAEEKSHENVYYTNNGRKVYGGGGITPDIEIEQALLTDLGVDLRRKNIFFNYSVDYLIDHEENVTLDYIASKQDIDELLKFAKSEDIEFEQTEVDSILNWIGNELTSNIIGRKFGEVERYKVILEEDIQLQKTMDIFDKCSTLEEMFEYAEDIKMIKKEEEKDSN
ncbi:MAG: S41 family peptidase [Candidatus Cloacimonetes bacterium]|nr:S41 family peptidase [Candidatus Cloacimonadota bacterium]